jgi:aerobic carbon-monoxide dehydrogenase large subunit
MLATAAEAPRIRLDHISTLPTTNPLRVRGVGEGGIIPVAPAIVNAISRALIPVGAVPPAALFRLPLTPEAVLGVIEAVGNGANVDR